MGNNLYQKLMTGLNVASLRGGSPFAGPVPHAMVRGLLGYYAGRAAGGYFGQDDEQKKRLKRTLGLSLGAAGLASSLPDIYSSYKWNRAGLVNGKHWAFNEFPYGDQPQFKALPKDQAMKDSLDMLRDSNSKLVMSSDIRKHAGVAGVGRAAAKGLMRLMRGTSNVAWKKAPGYGFGTASRVPFGQSALGRAAWYTPAAVGGTILYDKSMTDRQEGIDRAAFEARRDVLQDFRREDAIPKPAYPGAGLEDMQGRTRGGPGASTAGDLSISGREPATDWFSPGLTRDLVADRQNLLEQVKHKGQAAYDSAYEKARSAVGPKMDVGGRTAIGALALSPWALGYYAKNPTMGVLAAAGKGLAYAGLPALRKSPEYLGTVGENILTGTKAFKDINTNLASATGEVSKSVEGQGKEVNRALTDFRKTMETLGASAKATGLAAQQGTENLAGTTGKLDKLIDTVERSVDRGTTAVEQLNQSAGKGLEDLGSSARRVVDASGKAIDKYGKPLAYTAGGLAALYAVYKLLKSRKPKSVPKGLTARKRSDPKVTLKQPGDYHITYDPDEEPEQQKAASSFDPASISGLVMPSAYGNDNSHISIGSLADNTIRAFGMTPIEKVQTLAMIDEASNHNSRGLITTGDLVRAGIGYAGGRQAGAIAGKVLAGLGILPSETQGKLSRIGAWAGLLRATGIWS